MSRISSHILKPEARIYTLLIAFVALSTIYSIFVPPFEASDELWHYPMVKFIADHWALPVQDPQDVGPWRQEGSQPPLYYFVGAIATFWIDTSDVDVVRHLNPHADNGIATPDGNINLIVHHPEAEAFPWQGTTLAVHLVRFLSVLMGAVTVYLTYRLSLELVPDRPNIALTAAAINAFTPMFTFISGAVNNDNLVVPLCSLALLLMVRTLKTVKPLRREHSATMSPRDRKFSLGWDSQRGDESRSYGRQFTLLGIVVGLALLTKESAGGLIFLTALTVVYVAWHERSVRTFLVGGILTGGPTLLIAGWWYLRNWRLYGDPLGQNVFIEILGQRDVPADLAQLWRERISFIRGYWGNFGGLNVPMPDWVYLTLDVVGVMVLVGLLILLISRFLASRKFHPHPIGNLIPWLFVLLWPILVVTLWITWAATTWSSQGRLIFSAISVWSLLFALGWDRLTSAMPGTLRSIGLFSLPLFLFLVSLVAPFAWIRPAYARPSMLTEEQVAGIPQRVDAVFFHPAGGQLKLLGYDAPVQAAYPGEPVPVTLYWEALEPFNRDYSIFLHLVDTYDLVAAQRDAFPGMGTLSTQWIGCPNRDCDAMVDQSFEDLERLRWAEQRVMMLPETAYSPNQTVYEVGLYDISTRERLAVVNDAGQITGDNVRFGQLQIQARAGEVPNPINIDFGGEMALIGYDLSPRALLPGETTTLTLYWRGQHSMETNYSISTQFINQYGVKAAQKDAWPFDGQVPTSLWEPGVVLEESREMFIFEDTSPGIFDVYIAVYPSDNPDALLVVTPPGGRLQTDHVVLTKISVLP
jgi:4-amino-4-deoxy-L-arabinose transferase-like glycosyltransferase